MSDYRLVSISKVKLWIDQYFGENSQTSSVIDISEGYAVSITFAPLTVSYDEVDNADEYTDDHYSDFSGYFYSRCRENIAKGVVKELDLTHSSGYLKSLSFNLILSELEEWEQLGWDEY